jgi:hypothetical protein
MSERHQRATEPDEVPLPPIGPAARRAPTPAQPTYARRKAPDQQPWSLIGLGAVACLVGTAVLAIGVGLIGFVVGLLLIGLGSVVITIGTIAEGIRLGARWVAHDRGE